MLLWLMFLNFGHFQRQVQVQIMKNNKDDLSKQELMFVISGGCVTHEVISVYCVISKVISVGCITS